MSDTESRIRSAIQALRRAPHELELFKRALTPASDPISTVLRTHLFTEQVLEAHIRSWLQQPEALLGLNLRYPIKLELVGAFGAIEDRILQSLRALNKLRNDLAHHIDRDISEDHINNIGNPIGESFRKMKAEHPGDLDTQLSELLPHLAGLIIAQTRGPLASDLGSRKTTSGGKKRSRGK